MVDVSFIQLPFSDRKLTICAVTRTIVGLKKEESEALLGFLVNHIGRGIDYQARVRWAPKTVVVWDVSCFPAKLDDR
jgi:alpha-ketoglutarate-dependent taurine dioxygenase